MKVALTTLNCKYIHRNLALRWLYVTRTTEAKIFEFTIKDSLERCTKDLVAYQPDVIGISTYIWNGEFIEEWTKLIKKQLPQCRIVLGGPEVSYESERFLFSTVDAILRGEGERTFWQYVQGEKEIEGLLTHDYCSPIPYSKVPINYIEKFASPYLLEEDKKDMGNRYLYVETSRGCPYQCAYCLASLDNRIRFFSLEYLFNLFDELKISGVKQVKFLDRTFNASKERSLAIANKLLTMPDSMSFQFEIMADTLSEELLDLICNNPVKSRFRFEVGIQSFNMKTLHAVGRHQDLDKLSTNIKRLRKNQTIIHADLIAGLPYEDINSFKDTYRQLFDLNVNEMQVGILKMLKGSRLSENNEFEIVSDDQPPYQIISNPWMSKSDIVAVEHVALATEKLWNRNRCKSTLWYLYQQGIPMFDFMQKCGEKIDSLKKPYQSKELFEIVLNELNEEYTISLFLYDYYKNFKQRPKRLTEDTLTKKEKGILFNVLVNEGLFSDCDLHYSMIDKAVYKNQLCYQILMYYEEKKLPKRYFVSKDLIYLGMEDCNTTDYEAF